MSRLIRSPSVSRWTALAVFMCVFATESNAADSPAARAPVFRVVDLAVNEAQEVAFGDQTRVRVKLLGVDETRDPLRDAVRQARVKIELNDQSLVLTSASTATSAADQ